MTWTVADPALEPELRALGCHGVDPPLTSHITAPATNAEPPAVDGVEVRKIATCEQFVVGSEVSRSGWQTEGMEDPQAAWQRRSSRPGGEWLALIDAEPVADEGAAAGPSGLFLTGGVTVQRASERAGVAPTARSCEPAGTKRCVGTRRRSSPTQRTPRGGYSSALGFVRAYDIVELVNDPQAT